MFAVNLRREGTNGCVTAFCFSCCHLLLLSVVFLLKLLPRQHRYVLITLVLHLFRELNYSQFNDLDDFHISLWLISCLPYQNGVKRHCWKRCSLLLEWIRYFLQPAIHTSVYLICFFSVGWPDRGAIQPYPVLWCLAWHLKQVGWDVTAVTFCNPFPQPLTTTTNVT